MSESDLNDLLCERPLYLFATTPCRHTELGNGKIVSTTECYGQVSTVLHTIKFEGREELISLYDDEIEIRYDA